jgi:hypothetical protein
MTRWNARPAAVLVAVAVTVTLVPAAMAAGVDKERAAAIAKRAASARVERLGISYPPSAWISGLRSPLRRGLALRGRHERPVLGGRDHRRDERPSEGAQGGRLVPRLNPRRIARRVSSILGALRDRASRVALGIVATITARRPMLRELTGINPTIAATTLLVIVATWVLDHEGLISHRPEVQVGLAGGAFADQLEDCVVPLTPTPGNDQYHGQRPRA